MSVQSGSDVVEALAREMGLFPIAPNEAFGTYRDFRMMIRCFMSSAEPPELFQLESFHAVETTLVLMFQVVYPPVQDAMVESVNWPDSITEMIAAGRARISHERGRTWFTRFGVEHDDNACDSVSLINDLLSTLEAAGVRPDRSVCHVCMRRQVSSPDYGEHGIEQICSHCREARQQERERAQVTTLDGTIALMTRGPLAMLATAAVWSSAWIGVAWLLDRLVGPYRKFYLPHALLVETIAFLAAAWLLSYPQERLIGRIEGRGMRGARVAALSCLLGIVLGELAFLTFMTTIHRVAVGSALDPQFAWQVWYAGGVHSVLRLCLVGFAVAFAFTSAKPNS
ncbi:hypothetical protein RAS2_30300 [Phycisphaerae bacterium RAS2]|nr:hypothetical protein RAS2_30300 [Phycisphaerae bacterium RAS2]